MIAAAILARNEANRWLQATVESIRPHVDTILLLDDGSTDGTPDLARALGCEVRQRTGDPMWGQESLARKELWDWGSEVVGDGWLYISDADHELVCPNDTFRAMCDSWMVNAWGIPVYDCWDSPQRHRVDGQWAAYRVARPWLFRPAACPQPEWTDRGLHTGHAPRNFPYSVGLAPQGVWIRHYGWMRPEDREAKVARYEAASDQLQPAELAHLHSVRDAS